MIPAVTLAWVCVAACWAVRTWPESLPTARLFVDTWAALPAGTWEGPVARLGTCLGTALLVLGALGLALGAGRIVAVALAPPGRRASLALGTALGFCTLSLAATGAGLAGLMARLPLSILALGALAFGVLDLRDRRAALAEAWRGFREEPASTAAALGGAAVLWIVLTALPDTHEDPLVYHWAAPEYFLRAGRIVGTPWHFQWHNPLGVEMLFGLGLAVAGTAGIKAVNLALVVTALAATAALARRLDGRARGWAAVTLLACSPAIANLVWMAKSDLGLVTFWAAAFLVPLEWPLARPGGAIAAGLLAGFCGVVKWTAIFPMAGLGVWFLLARPRRRGLALISATALTVAAAWPLRNWLTVGNPVLPFLSRWFSVPWWGPEYERAVHVYARQVMPPSLVQPSYWIFAWKDAFGEPNVLGSALAALSPVGLAVFLPAAAGAACVVSVLAFLFLMDERDPRFLLPLAVLAAAAGEAAVLSLRERWPRAVRLAWPMLLGIAGLHLWIRAVAIIPPAAWCWAAGRMTTAELRRAGSTVLDEARTWCAERLSPDARILLEGEQKRFGWKQPVVSAHVVVVPLPWRWAKAARTPEDLAKKWRQAGIRYVAHNLVSARYRHQCWFNGPAWDDRSLRVYRGFGLRYLSEVYRSPHIDYVNGLFYVLRVDARPHRPRATVPVLPWTESLFARANVLSTPETAALGNRETMEALAKVPDVEDAIDLAATNLHTIHDSRRALFLNRILARAGFDGEACWLDLAVEESEAGNRRAAFAALRHGAMLAPSFQDNIRKVRAILYYNWVYERAKAGNREECCRLLEMCLRADPAYAPAITASARIGCPGGALAPGIGRILPDR